MKKILLILFIPFCTLIGQNSLDLDIKKADFNEVAYQEFYSKVYSWNQGPFEFLGPSAYALESIELELFIRFKVNGIWQEWQNMDDQHDAEGISDRQTWVLALVEFPIEAWQLRSDKMPPDIITMRFYWAPSANNTELENSEPSKAKPTKSQSAKESQSCNCPSPPICDRNCWCPNNDCPPPSSYTPTTPTHLIVHHSAGANTSSNFSAIVAYYWDLHVNTNGWSDIGYNWLIDPNGIVYEGRGSGNTGAHFSCLNSGTLGLCYIGNYQNTAVPTPGLQSLAELLLYEACQNGIDPADSSIHSSSQLQLRHISGHRDANSATVGCPKGTACPGQVLYNKLDSLALSLSQNTCLLSAYSEELTSIYIYPNPSEDFIHWDINIEELILYDVQGRKLALDLPKQKTLDVSSLSKGLYQLQFKWEGEWYHQKLWIQ